MTAEYLSEGTESAVGRVLNMKNGIHQPHDLYQK